MFSKQKLILHIFFLTFNVCVSAFSDKISVIGRTKWNYTVCESNLWTQNNNSTIEQIYQRHSTFIQNINENSDENSFYPIRNNVTNIRNPYDVPIIDDVVNSNDHITNIWMNYSKWETFDKQIASDVLIDDIISVLEISMKTLWNRNYTSIFFDFLKNKSEDCNGKDHNHLAANEFAEKYFTDTILIQLKAYIMLQLSYLAKAAKMKNFERNREIVDELRILFNNQYNSFTEDAVDLVWNLSRAIWSCDNFEAPDTYTTLTNFIQGYVDNEINLNPDGSCSLYCHDYKKTKSYNCDKRSICGANYLDHNKTRCNGEIYDCDYFGRLSMYCPNENDDEIDHRIEFVQLSSGRILGQKQFCPDSLRVKHFTSSLKSCRYCFCYCYDTSPRSHRQFSLREITSNISENKIITGIRFMKENGIIHLTAVERELLPSAQTNASGYSVVSNKNFTIGDNDVLLGIDYHELTYENRRINLDTITGERDQLLTGVRFQVEDEIIHLEARFTYFDELSGKLDLARPSEWKNNSNKMRNIISPRHTDIPTRAKHQSVPVANTDEDSIEFTPSSMRLDLGQHINPFFDTIQIEALNFVPLSGVGLFYKFQDDHGGYLAPRIITYDYASTVLRIRGAVGVYGV